MRQRSISLRFDAGEGGKTVVLVVLVLAWRWAWVGAVIYAGLGILYLVMFGGRFHWSAYVMIAGPLFLTGALLLLSWMYRKEIAAGPV